MQFSIPVAAAKMSAFCFGFVFAGYFGGESILWRKERS
jgi:hypothetical protein